MHPIPMKTENWKSLPVILDVSLLTTLLITVWTVIGSDLPLIFSGSLWGRVGSRRWHGLECTDKSILLSKRNGEEQMVQIPAEVCLVAVGLYSLEFRRMRATKYEEFIKIIFLLFLFSRIPLTTACDPGEYESNGVCCSLCSPGSRVSKHCTELAGTTCNPCTTGEYMEHPNGLEKCFKCKICEPELGLQVKQPCTYTHNTICEAKKGYYCINHCQTVREHKACPPGEGVKEKGTPFKDTVCEKCPDGTFSSNTSTTEECKKWTVCEMPNFKQVKPGSAEVDVTCEAVSNSSKVVVSVVLSIILVLLLTGILSCVWWKKLKHKTGNRDIQNPRNHNGDGKGTQSLTDEEKSLRDEEKATPSGRNYQK